MSDEFFYGKTYHNHSHYQNGLEHDEFTGIFYYTGKHVVLM